MIRLTPADAAPDAAALNGRNQLPATVESITFLGSVRRVGLDAAGQRVVADVPATASCQARRGDRVIVSFPIDACRVIADQAAEQDQAIGMEGGAG